LGVHFGDREAGDRQQVGNRPGEVTAAEQALLDRLEAVLPAADPLVGGQPMLDEVQRSARLEHPPQLGKGGCDVGDRAHRPGGERGIEAVVAEGQRLAIQA